MFSLSSKTAKSESKQSFEINESIEKYQKIKNLLKLEYKHLEMMQKTFISSTKEYNDNKVKLENLKEKLEVQKNNIIKYKEQHDKLKQKYLTLEVFSRKIKKTKKTIVNENPTKSFYYTIPKEVHEPEKNYLKNINIFIFLLVGLIVIIFFSIIFFNSNKSETNKNITSISSPLSMDNNKMATSIIEDDISVDKKKSSVDSLKIVEDNLAEAIILEEIKSKYNFNSSKLAKRILLINSAEYKEGFYIVIASCLNNETVSITVNEPHIIVQTDNKYRTCIPIYGNSDTEIISELNKYRLKHKNAWLIFIKA